ncbi:J domain-containing protein [Pseudomonas atagonensis]|uniref:J domain-containing protein n=1 Tax=Pseudomonas atagonensis TaxID=2609964 RepID=UPI001408920C|nr:J domain-containing protein [Pseudomonas atagonensis]
MNCWTVLGLEANSDLRSIKRQYAALLKVHRPDEDPNGFQRLREAYEQAMAWSRHTASADAQEPAVETQSAALALEAYLESEHDPVEQQAGQLLEDIAVDKLAERLAQARVLHCERAFEDQLLMMCLSPRDDRMRLAAWGLEHFNWLSAWQREDLSPAALHLLLGAYCKYVEQDLRDLLNAGRIDAFIERYTALKKADWLQPFERHDWFNEALAGLLVESNVWSTHLFETLCTHQHWSADDESRCSPLYWPMLVRRRDDQVYIATLEALARRDDRTPESRAAHLLMTPMSDDERRAFARRFFEADWNACLRLSETLKRLDPARVQQMPDGDPYFWKSLKQSGRDWPMFAGLAGASLTVVCAQYFVDRSGFGASLAAMLFWLCALAASGAALLWAWRPMADRFWSLDVRLSRALSPRLSFRRPAPLVLRELLPCWLMGALIWACCGTAALAGYAVVMLALSRLSRVAWVNTLTIKRPNVRLPVLGTTGSVALMVGVMAATVLFYLIARAQLMGVDQGLQPFAQRSCSGAFDSRQECRGAPDSKQWYGHLQAQEARR